jgi:molybdopterin molybdotransferase
MLTVEEAQSRILARCLPLAPESVQLDEAYGRVLAVDLRAPRDLPPFSNSSMDGYAVQARDLVAAETDTPVALRLIGEASAGGVFLGEVTSGTAVRIFTGAPLPAGADAVLQQELTQVMDDGLVQMKAVILPGTNVRAIGSDLRAGTLLVVRGTEIDANTLAVIAASGFGNVLVRRRPRVAIVSTGDELVTPGDQLDPGQIYNSNSPMLAAAVREAGGDPIILSPASDTEDSIRERFAEAQSADLILSSGGVSVGDYDLVRVVMEEMGEIDFWRVNVRPGKPLVFGDIGTTLLIGLPGNPVSSAVTFELFARPAIRTMLGCRDVQRPMITARLGESIARGDRRHYVRVTLTYTDGIVTAYPTGDQSSHRIASLQGAHGLAIIDEGTDIIPMGEIVSVLMVK